ncbi:hypothetical protein I8751_21850 [Nostocaceae cyanobacterium CENA357]|uniref:Bacteriocin n=1 Tax=Atlanticothrix silvestris CENA357 TaxID=1725252 RepID=A0A8J7L5R4_9CYAN|nr:hypothetical protein [Atlanticothrix silvestris]MBH8554942.1 hypothetical protein [Atlanticothrix silvestris CENA357]
MANINISDLNSQSSISDLTNDDVNNISGGAALFGIGAVTGGGAAAVTGASLGGSVGAGLITGLGTVAGAALLASNPIGWGVGSLSNPR